MNRDTKNNTEILDLFLICKILDTLPKEYFPFKSSWTLMTRNDRTIDNLTDQLCVYEKALSFQKRERQFLVIIARKSAMLLNIVENEKLY